MILRCIGVDDEKLALDLLENNISQVPFLKLVAKCKNAYEAMGVMQQQPVDLVFLDAQMPGIHGLKFAENLRGKAGVIFLTAHEQFALQGFNVNAIDYLLKPVDFDRFLQSCMKAFEQLGNSKLNNEIAVRNKEEVMFGFMPDISSKEQALFVHSEYNLVRISLNEIIYIEGFKDYVKIFMEKSTGPVVTRISMKILEEKLAPHGFLRIHKSYIISSKRIVSIQRGVVQLESIELPLSEGYREMLMQSIQRQNIL
jgi:DNA-binding LytR/AlgR family response regulator